MMARMNATTGPPLRRLVLDVPEVADLLGVSVRTVRTLIASGKLRSYKIGVLRKVDHQAVLDYLASVEETPAQTA
jgi:excisionase family DNA binding protein